MIPYTYSRSSFSAVHSCKISHFYYLIALVFLAYNRVAYITEIISPIFNDSKSLTGACPCLSPPHKGDIQIFIELMHDKRINEWTINKSHNLLCPLEASLSHSSQ